MELDNIDELLEKYFEGSTTVLEEGKLQDYFSQENVPAHLEQYIPIFQYFSNAKKEKFTKELVFPEPQRKNKGYYKWISIAAAAAVLMFGLYFGPSGYKDYQEKKEAEYAYQQTKKALDLLAANFNRGTEKVGYLNVFVTAKQKIYNNN